RIVAGEGISYERSPATIPRRQVAGETHPKRQVAGESPNLSLGKALNVAVCLQVAFCHCVLRMDVDDQAIQTILLGLPEDVYAAVDSCETAKKIWEWVRQMMKSPDIEEQEKKAKLFNEWEKFTSTDGESIKSYYHRFMQLMMAQNQQGYNAWQNGVIQVSQNAVQNAGIQSGGNQNELVVVPRIANQNGTGNVVAARDEGTRNGNQARCYNCRGLGHIARNCTARPRRRDAAYLQTQLLIAQKEEAGIQLQAEEFDFMAAAGDLDEIEEVNANCILMANLQHASTSVTQLDKALAYDTDGSAEVQLNDNCYDNEIFNMFTQEEQYTDLLEPVPEPQLVPQNKNHVTSIAPSMMQSGVTVETSSAPNEETRAHQETVYQEHDPPVVYDSEETLELAQDSREKMRFLKKEIKPANYAKINHLSGVFVPQTTKSKEELFLSNVSNMVTISKTISIPNEDLSDDTTSSVARKFLNELRARVFENTSESMNNTLGTSVTPHVDKPKLSAVTPHSKKLHASIPSHSVTQPKEFNVVKHRNVITPRMFKINPSQTSRIYLVPNKQSSASIRKNPITNFQHHVTFKENVSSDTVNVSSTGLVHTARTRRPQPKGKTRNARVPSASKSSEVKKNITVEDHRRTLLLSKNQKTTSSECNNIKLAIRNDKSEIVCGTCKQCLVTANHDACLLSPVNALNSRANNLCVNASPSANQKRQRTQVWKPKQVGFKERLSCKPRLPRFSLKWSPSGRRTNKKTVSKFNRVSWQVVQICLWCVDSGCSKHMTGNIKLLINFVWKFLGTVRFGNDHISAILGYGDLKWENITITRVYFVEGLGHNLFSIGQFCDVDLEVAFRRNTCFIRDLDGVDLLKGNRSTNLYTINIYDMASASPICLMARATPTKTKDETPEEYLDSVGITHETSAAKTPQQNGVVKRINRTLVEAARTMLIFSHAPLFLWAEAIATACYTQNRSIIHRRFNKTPYELIQGRKSDISYLHVFGALCYPKNDREDIGKLGAKGDISFFIGYSANYVAYRVYNRRTKKVIETINVTFDKLSAMAFEQNNSRPGLHSMTSGQISSEL
nr:integrase, catalytic region, zinc finger, CCHC-type, peptidase aspartic, catalytic [Tanacetum cinerariifolium]